MMVNCNNGTCKYCNDGRCKQTDISVIDDSCVSYRRQIFTDWSKLLRFNKAVYGEGERNG